MERMSTIHFDNTEIAFRYKNDKQLLHAYYMYRLINVSTLVKFGTKAASSAINAGLMAPVAMGMRQQKKTYKSCITIT
mgnify:CR=1 FL=1